MRQPFQPLLLLVISLICLRVAVGKQCPADKDREYMMCCLRDYKLGFDTLAKPVPGKDPPSCRLDLGLAQCLSDRRCYAPYTNSLRVLILNQLVFTNRTGICKKNVFENLLIEAENGFSPKWPGHAEALERVLEMENLPVPDCAISVYAICGVLFIQRLQSNPGFDPRQLCNVFKEEGACIEEKTREFNCQLSDLLTRFKTNSDRASESVLDALPCSQSDPTPSLECPK